MFKVGASRLSSIFEGKDSNTKKLVIKDTYQQSGLPIFQTLLRSTLKNGEPSLVLSFDKDSKTLQEDLGYSEGNLKVLNLWNFDREDRPISFEEEEQEQEQEAQVCALERKLKDTINLQVSPTTIFIENFNQLVDFYSKPCQLLRLLEDLSNSTFVKLVLLYHKDIPLSKLCNPKLETSFEYLQYSQLEVHGWRRFVKELSVVEDEVYLHMDQYVNSLDNFLLVLSCISSKGKWIQETQKVTYSSGYSQYQLSDLEREIQVLPEKEKEKDEFENLPFNLNLNQEQQSRKDQTVLPYTEMGSVINYVPDKEDDLDEDDPDDDLEI